MIYAFVELDTNVPTWRIRWPAAELRRRGHETEVYAAGRGLPAELPRGRTWIVHFVNKGWTLPDGRVITHLDICQLLSEHGPLYMTYDDDWTRMLDIQPRPLPPLSRQVHQELPELTRRAVKAIVSTPHLAEVFGRWTEVEVVPNYLPEWVMDLPRAEPVERVAWMGEMYVHGLDWNLLQPYAADLPPLYLIGSGAFSGDMLRKWGAKDVETTGPILDQRKLYTEMGRAVAAIIPLDDTPFNRGKSWTKPMEFMARGVQPYAMRHAEYTRLHELTGALPTVDTAEELVQAVNKAWDERPDASGLPDLLKHRGLTMEKAGGDAWEKALA